MKKRLIFAGLMLFLFLLTISLTSAIFTPTIPADCSNAQISNTWNSIFKESATGITLVSNTSETGKCNAFVAYKTIGDEMYILAGRNVNDSANNILRITVLYGNLTTSYKNIFLDELTRLDPTDDYGGYIISLTGSLETYAYPANISNAQEGDNYFKLKFKVNTTNWTIADISYTTKPAYQSKEESNTVTARGIVFTKNTTLFWDYQRLIPVSSCTPNWTAINTTCQTNDKKIQWFNDSNSCNQAPSSNITLTCDYDSNGVMGNASNISSITSLITYINSSTNLTRTMSGILKVELKTENYTAIEFDWNFSQSLDLDKIYIERQSSTASRGYLLIKGIPASKKIQVQKLTNSTKICVRNAELSSINDLTANCTSSNEILLNCPDSYSGISCSINNNFFIINGLTSSAVRETMILTTPLNCTPNWNCTNFSACANSLKSRTCNDLNHCNSSMLNKTDTQPCISIPSCTPNWNCTNWTSCSKAGNQTRICNDKNACNSTTTNKKTETRSCEYKKPSSLALGITIGVIVVIIIVIIILIVYFLNRKPEDYTQTTQPQSPVTQYGYSSQQGNPGNQDFNPPGL